MSFFPKAPKRSRTVSAFAFALAAAAVPACGSSGDDGVLPGSGGATSTGGTTASGGTQASGGQPGSGGAPLGSGGTVASTGGNAPGTGGASSGTGGATGNSGGSEATGGASATGGSSSDGGGTSTGGGGSEVTCPGTTLAPGNTNKTIMVGGKSRSYVLHVPQAYDGTEAVPFMIDFHGITGNGEGEAQSSPYPAQTDPDGVIMAFPTGLPGPLGNAWNVGPCCVADVDDVAFAKALVDAVEEIACIDPKRVYAVGFSMGGGLSHYLACKAADVFAAVAPAAFDLLEENVDTCQPSRPITVVSFRGTADSVVNYNGGYSNVVSGMPITFLGAEDTFAKWAELNDCTGQPTTANGCSTYGTCAAGTTVTLCTKQGGGHEAGNASVAWPILKEHTLP